MKFSNQFLPHVIVLALIIVAALICFVPCIQPYSNGSRFAAYEGFESPEEQEVVTNPIKAKEDEDKETKGNVESTDISVGEPEAVSKESFGGFLGNAFSGSAVVSKESFGGFLGNVGVFSDKKKESFSTLDSAPVGNYAEVLDRFSQVNSFGVDGVNGCSSSGLSNSKGYLCLTPDLVSALKTRGGNAGGSM